MSTPQSVAIVGFAHETLRHLKVCAHVDEIWTMNHHLFLDLRKPEEERELPRVDRLFELHTPDWFTRKEAPDSMEYRKWLGEKHNGLMIYMEEQTDEFPNAVRFPREEVREDIFKHLWRGEVHPEYYTSSCGFMLAMAIHMGIPHIELYGVEMASDTEYADQGPAVEYMIGFANGRDIDVVVHPDSRLFNTAVYGYEGVPHITRTRLDELFAHYDHLFQQAHDAAALARDAFNSGQVTDPKPATAAIDMRAVYYGAVAILTTLKEEGDIYTSAQRLEEKRDACRIKEEELKGRVNQMKAWAELLIKQGKKREVQKSWQKYQDTRADLMAHNGAVQVINKLRDECRLQKPLHVLRLMITE